LSTLPIIKEVRFRLCALVCVRVRGLSDKSMKSKETITVKVKGDKICRPSVAYPRAVPLASCLSITRISGFMGFPQVIKRQVLTVCVPAQVRPGVCAKVPGELFAKPMKSRILPMAQNFFSKNVSHKQKG